MKILALVFCFIGLVSGEPCTEDDTTACVSEICLDGLVPTCERDICTCSPKPTQPPGGCITLADCNSYWISHHCSHHNRACQASHCTCLHGHNG